MRISAFGGGIIFRFRLRWLTKVEPLFYRLFDLKFHQGVIEVFPNHAPVCEHGFGIGFLPAATDVVAIVQSVPIKQTTSAGGERRRRYQKIGFDLVNHVYTVLRCVSKAKGSQLIAVCQYHQS